MEFCWNFGFQISQFSDKISDPYNKTKILQFFWKPKTGKIEKKFSIILKN